MIDASGQPAGPAPRRPPGEFSAAPLSPPDLSSPRTAPVAGDLARQDPAAPLAPPSFDVIHARYSPGLKLHFLVKLRRQPNAEMDAEALAQNAWALFDSALRRGNYDPAKSQHSTFLYAIAHHVWLTFLRTGRASGQRFVQSLESAGSGSTPDTQSDLLVQAEEIDIVRRALAPGGPLSEQERQTLRALAQNPSDRQLAAILSCSASTAHNRRKAVLSLLAQLLAARDDSPSARSDPRE